MSNLLKAKLVRLSTNDSGTFGLMEVRRDRAMLVLATLELPWRNNSQGISCIPKGTYNVNFMHSPSKKTKLYRLANVKDRDGILIHQGNWAGDTAQGLKSDVQGCILVGFNHMKIGGQDGVDKSTAALSILHSFTSGLPLSLEILEAAHG